MKKNTRSGIPVKFFALCAEGFNMKRFEKTKGFILGILAMLLLVNGITSIAAITPTTKQNIDVYYGYTVYVDGVKFEPTDKNGMIEPFNYGGWIYAPFEHIAKALNKEAYWDADTRSLYLGKRTSEELLQNDAPEQPSTADNEKYGKLSGTLTWQYNKAIGTKPDVGAKAIIIPKNFERTDDMYLLKLDALTLSFNNYGIYSTKSDGYGKYIIDDIPTGDYYILLISQNAYNDLSIREDLIVNFWAQAELKDLFGTDIYSKMENSLKLYKHAFDTITIKEGKETIKSHDFGYSY